MASFALNAKESKDIFDDFTNNESLFSSGQLYILDAEFMQNIWKTFPEKKFMNYVDILFKIAPNVAIIEEISVKLGFINTILYFKHYHAWAPLLTLFKEVNLADDAIRYIISQESNYQEADLLAGIKAIKHKIPDNLDVYLLFDLSKSDISNIIPVLKILNIKKIEIGYGGTIHIINDRAWGNELFELFEEIWIDFSAVNEQPVESHLFEWLKGKNVRFRSNDGLGEVKLNE